MGLRQYGEKQFAEVAVLFYDPGHQRPGDRLCQRQRTERHDTDVGLHVHVPRAHKGPAGRFNRLGKRQRAAL